MLIEISAVNGRFSFTLDFIQTFASSVLVNAFLKELDENVIVYDLQDVNELELDDIDVAWIWKIWVDEKYRHQGLRTILVKHFEKKAKEKGATKILPKGVYDWNVDFFLKNNYKIAGELKNLPKGHSYFTLEKRFINLILNKE